LQGLTIEDHLKNQISTKQNSLHKDIPLVVAWGIWCEKNKVVFENQCSFFLRIDLHNLALQNSLTSKHKFHSSISSLYIVIKQYFPWDFFDGSVQTNPSLGGVGGIIHLHNSHSFSLSTNNGHVINNYAKLFPLYLSIPCSIHL